MPDSILAGIANAFFAIFRGFSAWFFWTFFVVPNSPLPAIGFLAWCGIAIIVDTLWDSDYRVSVKDFKS